MFLHLVTRETTYDAMGKQNRVALLLSNWYQLHRSEPRNGLLGFWEGVIFFLKAVQRLYIV